jgi:hypothetical protein
MAMISAPNEDPAALTDEAAPLKRFDAPPPCHSAAREAMLRGPARGSAMEDRARWL